MTRPLLAWGAVCFSLFALPAPTRAQDATPAQSSLPPNAEPKPAPIAAPPATEPAVPQAGPEVRRLELAPKEPAPAPPPKSLSDKVEQFPEESLKEQSDRQKKDLPTVKDKPDEVDVSAHPLYEYLQRKREEDSHRRVFVGFSFMAMQLASNTSLPVSIGLGDIAPALGLNLEVWPLRNFGARARWKKGIISYFPSVDPINRSFRMVDQATGDLLFRWYFSSAVQTSYLQFGVGWHYYSFDLDVDTGIPFVRGNRGMSFSVERKLSFNKSTGLRGMLEIIPTYLVFPEDDVYFTQSWGLGINFDIEVYYTIVNEEKLETIVSLIYSQSSYLYDVTDVFRNAQGRDNYQQHLRSFQLQFAARF